MKTINLFLFVLVVIMVGFNQAKAIETPSPSSPEALILNPGMASSCQNDFVVENLDRTDVELKITLGNEEWMKDRIKAMESKAYGLQGGISQAHLEGKRVFRDDVATVINTDMNARIRLHCLE